MRNTKSGQISLFFAVLMVSFVMLFMFVVNIAMLVHAKINLQNAADLAAYSGAATQARQLNTISYLNYEMRRQYKRFLYRYFVLGTMGSDMFVDLQRGRIPSGDRAPFYPNSRQPDVAYGVPAVCIVLNSRDNICRQSSLPPLPSPDQITVGFGDAINAALIQNLQQLDRIRQNNCVRSQFSNGLFLASWLFNASQDSSQVIAALRAARATDSADVLQNFGSLTSGIGLIPRLSILKSRIQTLEKYVNFPAQSNVVQEAVLADGALGTNDARARERTTNAMLTAFNTLGPSVFDAGSIQLTELLPAQILKLDFLKVNFSPFYVGYEIASGSSSSCNGYLVGIPVTEVPVAAVKSPNHLVYYAVELKARAKLLFSPFGPIELKAYAAASPFGSRIGPKVTPADFVAENWKPNSGIGGVCPSASIGTLTGGFRDCYGIPNLPTMSSDSTAAGWGRPQFLQSHANYLYRRTRLAPDQTRNNGQSVITAAMMNDAMLAGMVPNPWEAGRYNILHSIGADNSDYPNKDNYFQPFQSSSTPSPYFVWAPISTQDQGPEEAINAILNTMDAALERMVAFDSSQGRGASSAEAYKQALKQLVSQYINGLQSTPGENNETYYAVGLEDPTYFPDPQNTDSRAPAGLLPADQAISSQPGNIRKLASSWADGPSSRAGYSVKLISFSTLLGGSGYTTDLSQSFENTLPGTPSFDQDRTRIKH